MLFARDFIDLQFSFAERVSELIEIPLQRALLDYTNIYVRLGLGRAFDAEHSGWQSYISGVSFGARGRDWTHHCYGKNAEANTMPAVDAVAGCFSYALLGNGEAKLHFRNTEIGPASPLSSSRYDERRTELRLLFGKLQRTHGGATIVRGCSWLYHLAAYKRLFPPQYCGDFEVVRGRWRSMSLWGQFVDHRQQLKTQLALRFREALARCDAIEGLDDCFPLPPLSVCAPARAFYEFLAV